MVAVRLACCLVVMVLGAVGLNLTLQDGSSLDVAAPTTADGTTPHDPEEATSEPVGDDTGRKLLELTVGLDGFRVPCIDCHSRLGSPTKDPIQHGEGPHKHVVLEHGENNRCFNCHHPDSDKYGSFVRHDGSAIPVETVEQLCGKCHGPHYRAWKRGSHGQRTGYWDLEQGPQKMAHCNSCHDPHRPYFKPPPTLPGPRSRWGELMKDHPCRKEDDYGRQAE